MLRFRLICFLWGLLVAHCAATPARLPSRLRLRDLVDDIDSNGFGKKGYRPAPSVDPWYKAPEGWESTSPGTVLKIRPHAYNSTHHIPFVGFIDSYQLLYRTTDSHDAPTWTLTTVFIPKTHAGCMNTTTPKNCSHALLSYQPPYDSAWVDASPSYTLQKSEPYGEIALSLSRGWFVAVPDYEGITAAYGAHVLSAYHILDSLRAILRTADQYGFRANSSTTRVGIWGYSTGGSATAFAAEVAGKYAPDLNISGVVLGGVITNATTSLPLANGNDIAGLLAQGILGVTKQYPENREYIVSRLKPEGIYNASEFMRAENMSGLDSLKRYMYQDIYEYFIGGEEDLWSSPRILEMFKQEAWMGEHGVPKAPTFIYHAMDDRISPIDELDSTVKKYCDAGANVLYNRNLMGGHNGELYNGRGRAMDFLSGVLDGTTALRTPEKGCKEVNLTFDQDPTLPFGQTSK